jgi:hypothetical protein
MIRAFTQKAGALAGIAMLTGILASSPATAAPARPANTAVPLDKVTCYISSNTPSLVSGTLYGSGQMASCTPHNPLTCRTETDLQEYFRNLGGWQTIRTGTVTYNCPGEGTTTSVAEYTCSGTASHLFRTETIGVSVYGNTATGVADSGGVYRSCT